MSLISHWRHLLQRRNGLRVALWLLLISCSALQVVSVTHWHSSVITAAASTGAAPDAPAPDGTDHDGCLLCQAAAHAGSSAPPPAPWVLSAVIKVHPAPHPDIRPDALRLRPSHSWQGRAPPQV